MTTYELTPTNGRKSFYGKAIVLTDEAGNRTLLSYGTRIMRINADSSMVRIWNDWTTTTGNHVASFSGLNKKGFMALPLAE